MRSAIYSRRVDIAIHRNSLAFSLSGVSYSETRGVICISTSLATRPQAVRSCPDDVPPENRTLGWQVLAWTADYLQQPDGPMAGRPWEFTTEQAKIVLRWYAIDDQGKFVFRRGVLRRMKGWG